MKRQKYLKNISEYPNPHRFPSITVRSSFSTVSDCSLLKKEPILLVLLGQLAQRVEVLGQKIIARPTLAQFSTTTISIWLPSRKLK